MRHLLRCSFGPRHCDIKAVKHKRSHHPWVTASDVRRARWVYPRLAGFAGHRVTPFSVREAEGEGLRYFTFLREPRARLLSSFWHLHRGDAATTTPADLVEFCRRPAQRNVQTRMLCGESDAQLALRMLRERVGFVGLTEAFDVSLALFTQWLGDPDFRPAIHALNAAPFAPPWSLHDHPGLLAAVDDANVEDTLLYRAVVHDLFPARLSLYAGDIESDAAALRAAVPSSRVPTEGTWSMAKRCLFYKPLLHLPL